jgi:hypothetical protein
MVVDLREIPGVPPEWMAALDALVAASLVPAVLECQARAEADGQPAGEAVLARCRQAVVDEYVKTLRAVRAARGNSTETVAAIPQAEIPTTRSPAGRAPATPPIPAMELPETSPALTPEVSSSRPERRSAA